jgi:hypothetical protein
MYEFQTFVYLDVQKTGSRFIVRLLRKHANEKEAFGRPHLPVGERYDPAKFHFISVRDPLQQYISLYSYGCSKKGYLYTLLDRQNHTDLYDASWRGFKSWLDFVLDPENAALLDESYGRAGNGKAPQLLGLQSFRFLSLAMPDCRRLLAERGTEADVMSGYKAQKIDAFPIRHERFRDDLTDLVQNKLSGAIGDLKRALAYIKNAKPSNTSERIDKLKEEPKLGKRRHALLEKREWLLHELFSY